MDWANFKAVVGDLFVPLGSREKEKRTGKKKLGRSTLVSGK